MDGHWLVCILGLQGKSRTKMKKLTRREVLKAAGVGLIAALFARFKKAETLPEPEVVFTGTYLDDGDFIDFDSFSDLVEGDGWGTVVEGEGLETVSLEDWEPTSPARWAWDSTRNPLTDTIDFGFEPSDHGICFFVYESRGEVTNNWKQIAEDCKVTMGLEKVKSPMFVTAFVFYDNPRKAALTYRWDRLFIGDSDVIVDYETEAQYRRRKLEEQLEAIKLELKGEAVIA